MSPRQKAQSTLELLFISILVVTGIIVAGPYLLDSTIGHFKLWDMTAHEALNDRLVQAGADQININAPACTWSSQGGICGAEGCAKNERAAKINSIPVGCKLGYLCVTDNTCCDKPIYTQSCWRSTYVPTSGQTIMLDNAVPNDIKAMGFHGGPCTVGDRIYLIQCGANANNLVCIKDNYPSDGIHPATANDGDNQSCYPSCQWSQLPQNASKCNLAGTNLQDNVGIILVANGSCSSNPETKCEAYCNNANFTPSGLSCTCPPGFVNQGYCNSGFCLADTCTNANECRTN